jgi:hypothetical protein
VAKDRQNLELLTDQAPLTNEASSPQNFFNIPIDDSSSIQKIKPT